MRTWVEYMERPKLEDPTAVVASPGLRSVGLVAVEYLIRKLKPTIFANLYSTHFPVIYQTKPSYAPHPWLTGIVGVEVGEGGVELPKVEFYFMRSPNLVITKGYQANFNGQNEVAEKVLDLYEEIGVKAMIVLAGHGGGEGEVSCAATDINIMKEMEKYGVGKEYVGPFYGFSGLVFGFGKLRGIKSISLFGRTEPNLEDPESPDPSAARAVLRKLSSILNIQIDLSEL
ncbi:MAG: PAC2 family protein [Candidatus Geothermarchaeales archaeon]